MTNLTNLTWTSKRKTRLRYISFHLQIWQLVANRISPVSVANESHVILCYSLIVAVQNVSAPYIHTNFKLSSRTNLDVSILGFNFSIIYTNWLFSFYIFTDGLRISLKRCKANVCVIHWLDAHFFNYIASIYTDEHKISITFSKNA